MSVAATVGGCSGPEPSDRPSAGVDRTADAAATTTGAPSPTSAVPARADPSSATPAPAAVSEPLYGDQSLGEGVETNFLLTPDQLASMRSTPTADGAITGAVSYLSIWRQALVTADPTALLSMSLPDCRWCETLQHSLGDPAPAGYLYDLRVWPLTVPTDDARGLGVGARQPVKVAFELIQATTTTEGKTQYTKVTATDRFIMDIGMELTADGWSVYGGDGHPWE